MDDCTSTDVIELLDLPEPVLINILRYLDLDFLRHTVAQVSPALKELAHTPSLWRDAYLTYNSRDCWDDADHEKFAKDFMATPHLCRLNLVLENNVHSSVKKALIHSNCKINVLDVEVVDEYGPEIQLFLRQHPEIKELFLSDDVYFGQDISVQAGVAEAVKLLAPNLRRLDLSKSWLLALPMWELVSEAATGPSPGGEHQQAELELQSQPRPRPRPGLQGLSFEPSFHRAGGVGLPPDVERVRVAALNLAKLIQHHRHSLRCVQVDSYCEEVFAALAECGDLEELSVFCDGDGREVAGLLRALQLRPSLRRLRLSLPPLEYPRGGEAARYAASKEMLETSAQLSQLQVLELHGSDDRPGAFPGFRPLQPLLTGPSALRELRLIGMTPVGRDQLEELRSLAPPDVHLLLDIVDCPCSESKRFWSCRDRVINRVMKDRPGLEVRVDSTRPLTFTSNDNYDIGFLPIYTCSCDRKPPSRRS